MLKFCKKYNINIQDLFIGFIFGTIITFIICIIGFRFLI